MFSRPEPFINGVVTWTSDRATGFKRAPESTLTRAPGSTRGWVVFGPYANKAERGVFKWGTEG